MTLMYFYLCISQKVLNIMAIFLNVRFAVTLMKKVNLVSYPDIWCLAIVVVVGFILLFEKQDKLQWTRHPFSKR